MANNEYETAGFEEKSASMAGIEEVSTCTRFDALIGESEMTLNPVNASKIIFCEESDVITENK